MKKVNRARLRVLISTMAPIWLSGCMTYRWEARPPDQEINAEKAAWAIEAKKNEIAWKAGQKKRDAEIKAAKKVEGEIPNIIEIEPIDDIVINQRSAHNYFRITNKSKDIIYVNYRRSVIDAAGRSHRVVSGETKKIHEDRDSPDTPIAPGGFAEISLFPADTEPPDDYQIKVVYRLALTRSDSSSVFAVFRAKKPIDFPSGPDVSCPIERTYFRSDAHWADQALCYSTFILAGGWCWFISPRDSDFEQANELAKIMLGNRVTAIYRGRMSLDLPEKSLCD
jgi:hypothetical protein